jgi:hypothetical protein
MPRQIDVTEDAELQFVRQLYDACVERLGKDHEETQIVARYISELENRESTMEGPRSASSVRETTFVLPPLCDRMKV